MADLEQKSASQVVSVVGTDSAGAETNMVGATANGEIKAADRCDSGGVDTVKTVTTTAVELKVNVSVKAERKTVLIQPLTGTIKFGFSQTTQSFQLSKLQPATLDVGPNTSIWVKAVAGSVDVAIGEA